MGNEAHLMATENYFGLQSDGRNRAFIDRIVMRKITDERALAGAVGFSAIDLAVELPPHLLQTCIEQAKSSGRELWDERYQSLSYYFFALNHQHPFLGGSKNTQSPPLEFPPKNYYTGINIITGDDNQHTQKIKLNDAY